MAKQSNKPVYQFENRVLQWWSRKLVSSVQYKETDEEGDVGPDDGSESFELSGRWGRVEAQCLAGVWPGAVSSEGGKKFKPVKRSRGK